MAYDKRSEGKRSKKDILKQAKIDHKAATDAETKQREREKEDLRFQCPELQWTDQEKEARKGRPTLSVSLLTQPYQLILNQATSAQLGVEIHPVSEASDEEQADVRQGLYRRIERDSNAHVARMHAFGRAVLCGRGWYRINVQYDEDSDQTADQEIVIERILNQDGVFLDPSAQQPDYSDARWGMIVSYIPIETFEREFPNAEVPQGDREFQSWAQDEPDWVKEVDGEPCLLLAEYWYKEYEKDRVTGVKYCKATARDIVEGPMEWNGMNIPIVPVIGRELYSFDGERRWEGIVRQARDGQKFTNYAASTLTETMATEPKAPYILAEGQQAGHEDMWETAAAKNWPYLLYRPVTLDGVVAPPPQRAQVDTSKLGLALQAFQMGKQFVQTTTSVFEPSLGEIPQDQTAQSGRAILALQQQSDAGTSHFLQNLAKVSMQYEAKVILDMQPRIYDRPGRITQILTGENRKPKPVMLNMPFVPDQQGRPVPVTPNMQPRPEMDQIKVYDLSRGKYAVSVSVGKSFQTRRQEGQQKWASLLERAPQLLPIIGDIVYEYDDSPGHKEVAERLARLREKQFPGLGEDEEGGPTPEQLKGMLEQMGQELEMTKQQLAGAVQKIETDFAKHQITLQKTEMDTQSREAIAEFNKKMDLLIKKLELGVKSDEGEAERVHDAASQEFEAAHETDIELIKQDGEREKMDHEDFRSERDGDREDARAERDRQTTDKTNR